MGLVAPAGLHRPSGLVACNRIGRDSFIVHLIQQSSPVRIMSREVQKVDAGEDNEESAEQRNGVHGIGGIETFEENKRGAQGGCGEGDIVEWVNTIS